jgi:hypothetical protein
MESLPYDNVEFRAALKRVLKDPLTPTVAKKLFSEECVQGLMSEWEKIDSVESFQRRIISPALDSIVRHTSSGLTLSGVENNPREKKYLYISNHRDILCDPSFFTNSIFKEGFSTPKICLGDNLLTLPIIIDLVKMNKGITVKRGLQTSQLMRYSVFLSELIYEQIHENIDSVWIAQREGRAKDGNDQTHTGIIKMLTLSGKNGFLDKIRALHIVPVAASYEYDPCDVYKARELYLIATRGSYQKAPHEDQTSMLNGMTGAKGRMHIAIGQEITPIVHEMNQFENKRRQIAFIVAEIDRQIHTHYRNWPSNYLAYDLVEGGSAFADQYSTVEKDYFVERMDERIEALRMPANDVAGIRKFFLASYANPVKNALKYHPVLRPLKLQSV